MNSCSQQASLEEGGQGGGWGGLCDAVFEIPMSI